MPWAGCIAWSGDSVFFRGLRRYVEANGDAPAHRALSSAPWRGGGKAGGLELARGRRRPVTPARALSGAAALAGALALAPAAARCPRSADRSSRRARRTRSSWQAATRAAAISRRARLRRSGDADHVQPGRRNAAVTFAGRQALGVPAGTRGGGSTPGSVWVMDLLSGGEHEVELPRNAGTPRG